MASDFTKSIASTIITFVLVMLSGKYKRSQEFPKIYRQWSKSILQDLFNEFFRSKFGADVDEKFNLPHWTIMKAWSNLELAEAAASPAQRISKDCKLGKCDPLKKDEHLFRHHWRQSSCWITVFPRMLSLHAWWFESRNTTFTSPTKRESICTDLVRLLKYR